MFVLPFFSFAYGERVPFNFSSLLYIQAIHCYQIRVLFLSRFRRRNSPNLLIMFIFFFILLSWSLLGVLFWFWWRRLTFFGLWFGLLLWLHFKKIFKEKCISNKWRNHSEELYIYAKNYMLWPSMFWPRLLSYEWFHPVPLSGLLQIS